MDCPNCGAPSPDGSRFCSYCGKEMIPIEGTSSNTMLPQAFPSTYVPPQYGPPGQWVERPSYSPEQRIGRYFLHGIVFSILNLITTILWIFLALALTLIGLCFGLIIAIVLLFLIYGFVNSAITEFVWKAQIKKNLMSIFLHGLVLFFVILLASVPSIIIQGAIPGIVTSIAIFFVYCFVDGFLARTVAGFWEIKQVPLYPAYYSPYQQ